MPELKPAQRVDVEFIKKNKHRVLIANAPGTGKTPTTIRAVFESYDKTMPCLIVCPSSVTHNWKKEIDNWAEGSACFIVEGFTGAIPRFSCPAFYVCSWAILDARYDDFSRLGLRTIVADEAHFAKNPEARRSQALRDLCTPERGILLLTGTPIVNNVEEMRILQDLYGTTPPMIRRLLEDVAPDIPQKKRSYLYIELREKERKEYDRATRDFESWLRDQTNALTGESKTEDEIARILSAEALIKIGYLRRMVGLAKIFAAADFIGRAIRLGEPVVVFLEHQAALAKLSKLLYQQRIRHAVIEGATGPKKRLKIIEMFQKNDFPVVICTKAGKEGITLHAARHLLFVERFFTSADEEQAEDRIRRIGQRFKTTIWYLHALNTVDDRIDTIVRAKRSIVEDEIGLEDIAETDEEAVQKLLEMWKTFVTPAVRVKNSDLGLGNVLEPLPGPKETHGIVFSGKRWNITAARIWCKMNGYLPEKIELLQNRFKIITHATNYFKKGTFAIKEVATDIKVITGDRTTVKQTATIGVVSSRVKKVQKQKRRLKKTSMVL
jgi:SNF2 family DNA or RNA helicase